MPSPAAPPAPSTPAVLSSRVVAALVFALALLLSIRDAHVSRSLQRHPQQGSSGGGDPFAVRDEDILSAHDDLAGDGDGDDDEFGTAAFDSDDDAATDRSSAGRRTSRKRGGGDGSEFDEFEFQSDYEDDDDDQEFADGAGASNSGDHRVLIQLDDSQYTAQFETVKMALQRQYPELRGNIRAEQYPISGSLQMLSTVVSLLPMILMLVLSLGSGLLVGMGVPAEVLETIKANRMYMLPVFFMFNMFVKPKLTQTGAFEVVYNGAVVFSKLRTGVLPVEGELRQLVTALGDAGLKPTSNW